MQAITLHRLCGSDSPYELTAMLHRAFSRLGQMGLNCTCVDQSVEVTRERSGKGECYIAVCGERIAGTITVCRPDPGSKSVWYHRRSVVSVHQLGVDPEFQGTGLGTALLGFAESWARAHGYHELALDTAQPARHLLAFYRGRGFRIVEAVRFPDKRYRSVVLSKAVAEPDIYYPVASHLLRPRCKPSFDDSRPWRRYMNLNRSSLRQHRCLLQLPRHMAEQSQHRIEKDASQSAAAVPLPRYRSAVQRFMLPITIDAAMVTPLRRAVMGACGEMLRFLRIQPIARSNKVKVWLCLTGLAVDLAMGSIMRTVPAAEFGRIAPV
jgi:GNAT superfamily N-acetyltransferase